MRECLAVIGGSFDPVHRGHIALAQAAISELGAQRVSFMPCAQPAHKTALHASAKQRVSMLDAAINEFNDARIDIDLRELNRSGTSYSLLSLQELRREHGACASINFIIGWDSLQNLDSWFEWQNLLELCNFVIAQRPGYSELTSPLIKQELQQRLNDVGKIAQIPAGAMAFLPMPAWPVSSTVLRGQIAAKSTQAELAQFLSPAVLSLINAELIYQK